MLFSCQLYSLREHVQSGQDLLALLPKVRAMGFDGVEFAGFFGLAAEDLQQALQASQLIATGCHCQPSALRPEALPQTLSYAKTLGMAAVGVGWAPHSNPTELQATCQLLQEAAAFAAPQNITIYYHNHDQEFLPGATGQRPIEQLWHACALQLDTCWSYVAGCDNYDFITKNRKRIHSIHLKDIDANRGGRVLGEGIVDLAAVVRATKETGFEWLVCEHEGTVPGASLDEMARCLAWAKAQF